VKFAMSGSRAWSGSFAIYREAGYYSNRYLLVATYSFRPKKQVILGFKICPKKQVIFLYLESAYACKNQLVPNKDNK